MANKAFGLQQWSGSPHLLQEVLQQPGELVHLLVQELAAGDVHPVEDGVLLVAQRVEGPGAGLQDVRVRVLLHDLPDLSQQRLQVLERERTASGVSVTSALTALKPSLA